MRGASWNHGMVRSMSLMTWSLVVYGFSRRVVSCFLLCLSTASEFLEAKSSVQKAFVWVRASVGTIGMTA